MGLFSSLFGSRIDTNQLQKTLFDWLVSQGGNLNTIRYHIYDEPKLQRLGSQACACGMFERYGENIGFYVEWENYQITFHEFIEPVGLMTWNGRWEREAKTYNATFHKVMHFYIEQNPNVKITQ